MADKMKLINAIDQSLSIDGKCCARWLDEHAGHVYEDAVNAEASYVHSLNRCPIGNSLGCGGIIGSAAANGSRKDIEHIIRMKMRLRA